MCFAAHATAAEVYLLTSRPGSAYGFPRPAVDQQAVPLRTTFYLELAVRDGADDDVVLGESVEVQLQRAGEEASLILGKDVQFGAGYRGFVRPHTDRRVGQKVIVAVK